MQPFKYNIGIVTAGLAIDPQTFGQTALGGSETALICMARALAAEGQKVTVFCVLDGPEGQRDPVQPGVQYFHIDRFDHHIAIRNFDAMIVSRHVGYAAKPVKAGTVWYWAHDIAPQTGFDSVAWPLDRMLFLSKFHRGLYEAVVHKGFHSLMHVTRNGIEADRIKKILDLAVLYESAVLQQSGMGMRKQANRFCYTSRPERGAMFLLGTIWPRIRQQIPDAELHLAWYEIKNMAIGDAVQKDIDFVHKLIKESTGVIYHGALPKDDLYGLIQSCNALLYPCTFPESSCITAIEAMALGTYPVTTDAYALTETCGEYGHLITGQPGTPEYDDTFVNTVIDLYEHFDDVISQNDRYEMSSFTRMHHDWGTIAKEWLVDLNAFFDQRFAERFTSILDNHLYHSDVTLVRDYCDNYGAPTTALEPVQLAYLHKAQGMLDVCQEKKEEYMRGASHMHWRENGRFLKAIEVLGPTLETATMVTDVGCGTGDFLACLHMRYPHLMLVGLDFSTECIDEARAFIASIEGADPSKFTFHVRTVEEEWTNECFDAVFCGEVLEHVENTQAMLTKLEGLVKPGGRVCLTTPVGPWSQIAFRKEGPGIERHIHHFSMTDLQEILGGRGNTMTLDYISAGATERGEAIGNFITCWTVAGSGADRKPFGYLNVFRKVRTMRPYQKLSVCMIVRNEENSILRCLKSFARLADEILIGDTGSTDMTQELIGRELGGKLTQLLDIPQDIDGDGVGNFSAWRNAVIAKATGDWILSVDADEIVANGQAIRRFLETPSLNAYAIAQLSLSLDHGTDVNQPQRLFRNHQGYRFKGVIHEHLHTAEDGFAFVEPFLILADVTLPHDGYMLEEGRYRKTALRNLPMLRKDREKYPDRVYGLLLEMRDVLNICRWARAKLGGLRQEDVQALRNLLAVYEAKFSEPGNFFYADATRYQQDALAILAILNVTPAGQRHLPLHAQIQVAVTQGPLTQGALDQTRPTQRWFKNIDGLRDYLIHQTDIMARALPAPIEIVEEVPATLLSSVSVP